MFAKPMFSMLVWSYCVNGHLNSNGHEAAITSSAAKIGGTGKTLNESVKNAGDCWQPFLVENEMCARRFHLAVSLQSRLLILRLRPKRTPPRSTVSCARWRRNGLFQEDCDARFVLTLLDPLMCAGRLDHFRLWPKPPVRGGAAIWPLSVEHRTVGGRGRLPPLLTGGGPKKVARSQISRYVQRQFPAARPGANDRMMSATDSAFLGVLENWLRSRPEILVLIQYSRAAGKKEFEFFFSYESLAGRLNQLPPSTAVVAFRDAQLPLRGVVDEDFISTCLNALPENSEFLVLERRGRDDWVAGETHAELRNELQELTGRLVSVGPYPPWLADTTDVISAVVPDEDGVVTRGVY
jgi:hypothetical protein